MEKFKLKDAAIPFFSYHLKRKVETLEFWDKNHVSIEALEKVKKGDGVRVTYEGLEKKKTGDGSYRNFKVGIKKFEPDPEPIPQKESPTLADNDDPEAVATIGLFNDIINSNPKTKGLAGDARSKEIIRLAENDEDMDEQSVARVIKQLAADAKKAQNK